MSDAPEDSRQDSDPSTPPPPPPSKVGEPMVEISSVNKHFGELHVLKDIDLTVGKGEVVVVLGPSGSGKSTLCRTINRLETFESGSIAIDGQPLPEEGKELAHLRADVGMVFQSFNLFAHKTILQAEEVGRGAAGQGAARAGRGRPSGGEVPRSALRRPAAARRDRPVAGDGP